MEKSIIDMLSMEESAQDATSVALDPIDVFGEKSKNADEAIDYGKGLSQSELLDIAISSATPMAGSIKAGKGAMSFLKGLFKKSQSQNIAKPNRSEIQRIIRNLEGEKKAYKSSISSDLEKMEIDNYFEVKNLNDALGRLASPEKYSKLQDLGGEIAKSFKPTQKVSDIMELQNYLSKGRKVSRLTSEEGRQMRELLKAMPTKSPSKSPYQLIDEMLKPKPKGMRKVGIKVKD